MTSGGLDWGNYNMYVIYNGMEASYNKLQIDNITNKLVLKINNRANCKPVWRATCVSPDREMFGKPSHYHLFWYINQLVMGNLVVGDLEI